MTQPDKNLRRAKGKDGAPDAISAAAPGPQSQVDALRVLRTTRKTDVHFRRATLQQIHNTVVPAP